MLWKIFRVQSNWSEKKDVNRVRKMIGNEIEKSEIAIDTKRERER